MNKISPSGRLIDSPGNNEALVLWHKVMLESVNDNTFDLSVRQMALMLTVYLDEGRHTVKSLRESLGISKPAICRALDSLSKYNLVERRTDPDDRRVVLIQKTDEGYALLGQFSASILRNLMEIQ